MLNNKADITKNQIKNNKHLFKSLLLVLTVNCKLQCKMCFNWKNNEINEIENKYLEETIRALHENGFIENDTSIIFSGGEVLLKEDIFSLIKFANKLGLKTSLGTSGDIYNDYISGEIIDSRLDCIALPLDSLDQKNHDYLRGVDGVFKNVMRIIQDHPHKVNLTCTISAYNINEIYDIAQWAESNDNIAGLGYQAIVAPFNIDAKRQKNWFKESDFSHLWPKDFYETNHNLDKLIEFQKKSTKIYTTAKHLNFFKEYFKDPNKINRNVQCKIGDYSLTIMNKGDVLFCNYLQRIGNIREADIIDILSSQKVFDTKKAMLECKDVCEFYVNCFFED